MSYREKLLWLQRIKESWNKPDRTDHYLMLIAKCVASVLNDRPPSITDMQLKFTRQGDEPETVYSEEEAFRNSLSKLRDNTEFSKAAWGAVLDSGKVNRPKVDNG